MIIIIIITTVANYCDDYYYQYYDYFTVHRKRGHLLEQKLYALTRSAQTRHRKNQKHLPETETLNVRHTTIEPYPIRSQVRRPFQSQHGAFGLSLPCVKLWTWDSRFWLSCLGFCLSCDRVLGLLWILLAQFMK